MIFLIGAAIIAAIGCAACALADDTIVIEPTAEPIRRACDCTGCGHTGTHPITWRDGATGMVCEGDYNNGQKRGWFRDECDVDGCHRPGAHVVESAFTGRLLYVCTKCKGEGMALRMWITAVAR